MEVTQRRPPMQDLLGPLSPGLRQLEGKSFFLDAVRSRSSALMEETIARLGGKVESFLNKDVTFVVSGSRETWQAWQSAQEGEGPVKVAVDSSPTSSHQLDAQDSCSSGRQRPATPRPAEYRSRGKALLEKAIRSNERCPRSSVLANASSWGIKILHVDDFLPYLNRLLEENCQAAGRELEKTGKSSSARVVKGTLKSPYIKIEDFSRRYRPLHTQSAFFPLLDFAGKFSPFQPPASLPLPKGRDPEDHRHGKAQEKDVDAGSSRDRTGRDSPPALIPSPAPTAPSPAPTAPSPPRVHRKSPGFCECCQLSFKAEAEHLQSDQHRQFARDGSHYAVVDRLISLMQPDFSEMAAHGHLLTRSPPPFLHTDPCLDLEPQLNSDAERALQALLSPPRPDGGPTAVTPAEEVAELRPAPVAASGAPSLSPQEEAVSSVPAHSSPLAAAPSAACGTWGDGAGPGEPAEDVAVRSSPPSAGPLSSRNGRKRARSYSLSPRISKKQRTTMSDPIPADLHWPPYPRPPLDVQLPLAPASCQLLTPPPPAEACSSDQLVGPGVRPHMHLVVGGIPSTSPECKLPSAACSTPTECPPPLLCNEMLFAVTPSGPGEQPGSASPGAGLSGEADPPLAPLGLTNTAPLPHTCTSDTAVHQTVAPQPFPVPSLPPGSRQPPEDSPDSSTGPLSRSFSSALLPGPSAFSPSSSVSSDWDCDLLSWMSRPAAGGGHVLDRDLLQRPCVTIVWDVAYQSRLCSVLHPPTPPRSVSEEEAEPAPPFRTFGHSAETVAQ